MALRFLNRATSDQEPAEVVEFTCNVCGADIKVSAAVLGRELPSCDRCRSTVRMRAMMHVLSIELFGRSLAVDDFPARPELRGLGMSDWEGYAKRLR